MKLKPQISPTLP